MSSPIVNQSNKEPLEMSMRLANCFKKKIGFSRLFVDFISKGLAWVNSFSRLRKILAFRIERNVRDKIMEWRPRYVTRWNRFCQIKFRELLPKLENSRTSTNNEKHQDYLKSLLDQHQVRSDFTRHFSEQK